MYKILNVLSPDIMQDIFETTIPTMILAMRQHFPQEILKQLDMDYRPSLTWFRKIWDLVPNEMIQVTILNDIKAKIKIWKLENYPCRLSRTYLPQIGFSEDIVRLRVGSSLRGNVKAVVI